MESAENLSRYAKLIQSMIGTDSAEPMSMRLSYDIASLVKHQQATGAFLPANQNIHPEMRWFDDLVILHWVANNAVASGDVDFQNAARKAAEHYLREIQPDHATTDPWGLLAFIQYAPPLADQVLHGVQLNYPRGVGGNALLLLRDVLYGLRILMAEKT